MAWVSTPLYWYLGPFGIEVSSSRHSSAPRNQASTLKRAGAPREENKGVSGPQPTGWIVLGFRVLGCFGGLGFRVCGVAQVL